MQALTPKFELRREARSGCHVFDLTQKARVGPFCTLSHHKLVLFCTSPSILHTICLVYITSDDGILLLSLSSTPAVETQLSDSQTARPGPLSDPRGVCHENVWHRSKEVYGSTVVPDMAGSHTATKTITTHENRYRSVGC